MELLSPKTNKLIRVLLALVILLGLILRVLAVKPGYYSHGDELMFSQAIYMLQNKTLSLEPHWMGYPPLVAWIMLLFFTAAFIPLAWLSYFWANFQDLVAQFGGMYQTTGPIVLNLKNIFEIHILGRDWINALYWGRYVTAIFGAGVIFLIYKVAFKFSQSKTVALLAALFTAVNYRLVLSSHIGFIDMYNVFFLLLSLWAAMELLSRPNLRNYLFAWVTVALSFLTKYQVYGFIPLFLAHVFVGINKVKNQKTTFFEAFLNREVILGGLVALLVIIISHGYHFLYLERVGEINTYQAAKYGFGRNILDIFPISYLFHAGVGPTLSILAVVGVILAIRRKPSRNLALILLSPVPLVAFLYMFYTSGGFYTRNIIVLIPLGLIFAAYAILRLCEIFMEISKQKFYRLSVGFLGGVLFFFSLKDHLINSFTLAQRYSKPSTMTLAKKWIWDNISGKTVFGTDYPVLIPPDGSVVSRALPNTDVAISYLELLKDGYDQVVVDISSLHSYYLIWWMRQPTRLGIKFWQRPDNLLSQNYKVLSLRELLWSHTLATFFTGWQVPGFNLAVFDIQGSEGCPKTGYREIFSGEKTAWTSLYFLPKYRTNLIKPEEGYGGLVKIKAGNIMMGAVRWQTEAFSVEGLKCYRVSGSTTFGGAIPKEERGAFLRLDFYRDLPEVSLTSRPLITFVSERAFGSNGSFGLEIKALAPQEARYAVIGFQVDGSAYDFTLNQLRVDQSLDKLDLPPRKQVILEDKNLFLPNNEGIL